MPTPKIALDLGDVVLVAGVRYDYYWSKAWRWNEYPGDLAARSGLHAGLALLPGRVRTPSATAKCALVQDPSHNYLSPHVQVSFPVTDKTNFRLSYAQNVQAPDFGLIYDAALFDINVSGQNQRGRWGGDLDFGKTITFEFGARHAFSDDMVLDVAVYNNDIVANPSFQFEHPIDPVTGQAAHSVPGREHRLRQHPRHRRPARPPHRQLLQRLADLLVPGFQEHRHRSVQLPRLLRADRRASSARRRRRHCRPGRRGRTR